jgi:tRNA-specific 2-thiouridylase
MTSNPLPSFEFELPKLEKPRDQTTIVVGMSGGVDSSVTAAILKANGFRVIGLFMKNWDEPENSEECSAAQDYEDVARVCDPLEIPYYTVNFAKEYWDQVFREFLSDYQKGYTPNPDVLCNREIKFKAFFEKASDLGADYLATGHYCRLRYHDSKPAELLRGLDPNKDQTYFLNAVSGNTLSKVLFPVGHFLKPEVRAIADHFNLATKKKKDSTGICFIGERNFPEFLGQYIKSKRGPFMTLDQKVVGWHRGAAFYTFGQRRGLGLGGEGERWFVLKKDITNNIVYVGRGENHPALMSSELTANELSWVGTSPLVGLSSGQSVRCQAKVRYRQPDQECTVYPIGGDRVHVVFDQPQRAVTPRQAVVFYQGEICLGGGMIEP